MGRAEKLVLAYSGGVDAAVGMPYLEREWGIEEVITLAADLERGEELELMREKVLKFSAAMVSYSL